jgi:sugar lactone lactonase YvrE
MCIDAEGYLWVAHWNGWRISRFDPAGRRERQIRMPVPHPTSLCFGGANLDRLYVTSAAQDLDRAALEAAPLSGSLFVLEPGTKGLPASWFEG